MFFTAFGPAKEMVKEIGEPTITEWCFNKFIVYFKANEVLHSVLTVP